LLLWFFLRNEVEELQLCSTGPQFYLKIFRKLTDGMKKIRLKTVKVLPQQTYSTTENSLWVHENSLVAAYGHGGHT
jgi:hypothetical protein